VTCAAFYIAGFERKKLETLLSYCPSCEYMEYVNIVDKMEKSRNVEMLCS
jgi:hypothetical protein